MPNSEVIWGALTDTTSYWLQVPTYGAVIAFVVFGIVFCVNNYAVCSYDDDDQPQLFGDTNLFWIYSVTFLSFYIVVSFIKSSPSPWHEIRVAVVGPAKLYSPPIFVVEIGMFIWGALLLFGGYTCEAMKSTDLYIWGYFAFFINLFSFIFYSCMTLVTSVFPEESESEEESPLLRP